MKAVITASDFGEVPSRHRDRLHNVMAHEKVLYEGHAVAAVAATDKAVAKQALKLINVKYAVLPHVTDVEEAIKPDAPLVSENLYTAGVDPKPTRPSNIAARSEFGHGDIEAGFAEADIVIERTFKTEAAHQGYIEPHACVASFNSDGSADLWCCTQGAFSRRERHMRRTPGYRCIAPAGDGIWKSAADSVGKTVVYLEPLALALSRKAGRPVKMTMSRAEVFMATGPTASSHMRVKIGVTKDGRITAAGCGTLLPDRRICGGVCPARSDVRLCLLRIEECPGDGLRGSREPAEMCAAYRAPGAPIAAFAVESVVDEIARIDRHGPAGVPAEECRQKR